MEQTDSHYDKNVLEFLTIGVHFCAVLEDAQNSTRQDFISKISKILPLMYVKAQLLPEYDSDEMFEIGYDEYISGDGVCLIEWADLIEDILPKTYIKVLIDKDLNQGSDYRRIITERIG